MKPIALILILLCAGCTTQRPTPVVNVPRMVAPLPKATVASAAAVAPQPVKPLTLAWNNPNPAGWPLVTEIHSTTDLRQPFALKAEVPPGVLTYTLQPTAACEFFICRFRDPATGEVSTWNVK